MNSTELIRNNLKNGVYDEQLAYIYSNGKNNIKKYADRYIEVMDGFEELFGKPEKMALFSAPGRTEIGGNHTDHQHGCVLAASVNLDVIAAVALNGTDKIRIKSKGYDMDTVDLNDLEINDAQYDKAISLIKGVTKKFVEMGYDVKGFDAYTISNVLKGSGLSSSAAFEVLIGTILNGLFANNEVSAVDIAKISQYAENVYFGKPSGLMDQMASSVGAVVSIDFGNDEPIIKKVDFDLTGKGYALCIIDSGADHADLTYEYAAVPAEMKAVAEYFGKSCLREVDKSEFIKNIKNIREKLNNDRAVLRAYHYFNDSDRAAAEAEAIKNDDFDEFFRLVKESGRSSFMYLQNIYSNGNPKAQAMSVALAMCDELLGDKGAYRVHGGGFAGTVQAFVPLKMLDSFKDRIETVLGDEMCHVLSIRPVGGYELKS